MTNFSDTHNCFFYQRRLVCVLKLGRKTAQSKASSLKISKRTAAIFRFLSDIEERKWRYTKNKIENLKNLDAAKIARKNPPIGKQFWQVTIKVDSHRYKEKKSSATLTLWVTVE